MNTFYLKKMKKERPQIQMGVAPAIIATIPFLIKLIAIPGVIIGLFEYFRYRFSSSEEEKEKKKTIFIGGAPSLNIWETLPYGIGAGALGFITHKYIPKEHKIWGWLGTIFLGGVAITNLFSETERTDRKIEENLPEGYDRVYSEYSFNKIEKRPILDLENPNIREEAIEILKNNLQLSFTHKGTKGILYDDVKCYVWLNNKSDYNISPFRIEVYYPEIGDIWKEIRNQSGKWGVPAKTEISFEITDVFSDWVFREWIGKVQPLKWAIYNMRSDTPLLIGEGKSIYAGELDVLK